MANFIKVGCIYVASIYGYSSSIDIKLSLLVGPFNHLRQCHPYYPLACDNCRVSLNYRIRSN